MIDPFASITFVELFTDQCDFHEFDPLFSDVVVFTGDFHWGWYRLSMGFA